MYAFELDYNDKKEIIKNRDQVSWPLFVATKRKLLTFMEVQIYAR